MGFGKPITIHLTKRANFSNYLEDKNSLVVQFKEIKSRKGIAKVHQINGNKVMGSLLIYVDSTKKMDDEFLHDYFYLNDIYIKEIKGALNPHAFDAKGYYRSKGVTHQGYAREDNIWLLKENQNFLFFTVRKSSGSYK